MTVHLIYLSITVFLIYMIIRNNCVRHYRVEMIDNDHDAYKRLPSYDTMVFKFWIWPLSKFEGDLVGGINKTMTANGFVNGEKIEDIFPPCSHTRLLHDICGKRTSPKYEEPCRGASATQRGCREYEACMLVETYRNQFREGDNK